MTANRCIKIAVATLGIGILLYLAYDLTADARAMITALLEATPLREFANRPWHAPAQAFLRHAFLLPGLWIGLAATLALQKLNPVDPALPTASVGFRQDLVWFFYESVLHAFVIITYVYWLQWIYARHFAFLTVELASHLSYWLRFAAGALLLDFFFWVQHYLNHKVPWLWRLHAVHHSQRQLNFFTDFRYHVLEYIVRHTVYAIPLLVFHIDAPTIIAHSFFVQGWSRFIHGNIKMNLGPLRYILVTPQSHRVHHSILPQHQDLNFGGYLSIWDYLFRRQYRRYDEYPPTGISDERFPLERTPRLRELLTNPLAQMLYPLARTASLRTPRS